MTGWMIRCFRKNLLWHDVIYEFLGIVDEEAASVRLPGDDVRQAIGFDLVEDRVELDGEGDRDASAAARVELVLMLVLDVRLRIKGVIVVIVDHKVSVVVLGGFARLLRLATALGTRLLGRSGAHRG